MCFLTRFLHTCSVFEIHIVQFSKTKLPCRPRGTAFLLYYPVSALSSVFRNFFQKTCRLVAASFPKKPPSQGSSAIIPKPIRFCQGGFCVFLYFFGAEKSTWKIPTFIYTRTVKGSAKYFLRGVLLFRNLFAIIAITNCREKNKDLYHVEHKTVSRNFTQIFSDAS